MFTNAYLNNRSLTIALVCVLMVLRSQVVLSQTVASTDKQNVDFYNIVYNYFNQEYGRTLALIDIAQQAHKFDTLPKEDADRLRLMQGASELNMGLLAKSQASFRALLDDNTSEYVKARTWYWLAKSAFEQQQIALSSEAYQNIIDHSLVKYLTEDQWQELSYYSAYSKLVSSSYSPAEPTAESIDTTEKLSPKKIYASYLLSAKASLAYNSGDYTAAEQEFIAAKQALLLNKKLQRVESSRGFFFFEETSSHWLYTVNKNAQGLIEEKGKQLLIRERNALFDSLNLHLAYSLIKQSKYQDALEVLRNVSIEDGQSQQARLVLGWTLAREYRWDLASSVFQSLVDEGGSYALQAKYAQAFSFQEQGLLNEAFFALDDFIALVDTNLSVSKEFKAQVLEENFFDSFDTQWPADLVDLKRLFLTASGDTGQFDTTYLVEIRKQAHDVLTLTEEQQAHLTILKTMLSEREVSFRNRQNALSLSQGEQQLAQAKSRVEAIEKLLASNDAQTQQSLKVAMLPEALNESYERLESAKKRHQRLLNDSDNSRPVKPDITERLEQLDGILKWHMDDAFIGQRWQHLRLLEATKKRLLEAEKALESVMQAQQSDTQFAQEQARIEELNTRILTQRANAQSLFHAADTQLSTFLVDMIDEHIENLNKQSVSARLQRIRIQDLHSTQKSAQESEALTNEAQP